MIRLVSHFLNDAGKKHLLSIKEPNTDLHPSEVKASLELLTTLDIFEKDGIGLFQQVVSAKYVETIETPIFKGDEFFSEEHAPITLNQSMLTHHPAMQEPDVQIDESPIKEVDYSQKLEEIKARSSYRAVPAVPQVTLEKPKEAGNVVPETNEGIEETKEPAEEKKASTSYRLSDILRRRRNRRKAQEKQKKRPD